MHAANIIPLVSTSTAHPKRDVAQIYIIKAAAIFTVHDPQPCAGEPPEKLPLMAIYITREALATILEIRVRY